MWGEDNDFNIQAMITRLMWTIWTSLSAVRERLLNLITHSLPIKWVQEHLLMGIWCSACGRYTVVPNLSRPSVIMRFYTGNKQMIAIATFIDWWMAEVPLLKLPLGECLWTFFTDNKSSLIEVMAWCHQATSHCLSQCWPRSLSLSSPIGLWEMQQ